MPGFVKTPEDEKKWAKAKSIVSDQRGKPESEFEDKDWGLCNHIFHNMNASQVRVGVLLAHVEDLLARRKQKQDKNASLPQDAKALVEALSALVSVGSVTIAALRKSNPANQHVIDAKASKELVDQLNEAAKQVQDILGKLKDG